MAIRVLISGATGFAGSFLVQHCVEMGWEVHGTCLGEVRTFSWLPAEAVLHSVDLRDASRTAALVQTTKPEVVIHLAAHSSVRQSLNDPMGTIHDNIEMQLNLLESVAEHAPGSRVVVVGSGDEYGAVKPDENPVHEKQELRPLNPYAISKVAQDLMGYQYATNRGLDVVRVRPFMQAGPRRPDQFATGSFARQVAEIEAGIIPPVVEVGNIDIERDITDVRDTVRGYLLLAEKGQRGEVYNLGRGSSITLRELLLMTMKAAGIHADIREHPGLRRPGEPERLVSDSTKARSICGWQPAIPLEKSAVDSLDYWRQQVAIRTRHPS